MTTNTTKHQPPKRQMFSRATLQTVVIMLVIALPFWLIALVFNDQQSAINSNGIIATAKIIDKQTRTSDSGAGGKLAKKIPTTSYFITYQFPVIKNGKPAGSYKHTKQINRDDFKDFGIGGSLTVRYETGNPKNHIATSLEKDNGSDTMLTIALILTVLAGGIAASSVFKYIFYSSPPQ